MANNTDLTIYGIKSCNSMKKAFTTLNEMGIAYQFFDYKKQAIEPEHVSNWVNALGIDKVLNKRGTTWRKLTDEQKAAADGDVDAAIQLLCANPSMIKRPIIEGTYQGKPVLLCGYNDAEIKAIFGS